ncbi:probable 2-oxoglutarate-dependent dioxygenase SLC1 [Manihot esculenta]|uniref:probable 2-oxoglutarate-dependent dioxygenase SLC1 n=1 Tax=Manihot esculenta TaxID=3983 RepID=UPI001CC33CBA|nr:probable 2-oxoglutarate-dependent dioxygenase SLC1 [Manihot esculenta]
MQRSSGGVCKRTREVANELLKGISKSLGLEENYITKRMEVGSQMVVANLYPPCPQPQIAIGLPPHSDYGLITLLIQNQLMHNGYWVPVNPLPDSIIVNIGDHMEILTNGKYKSVVHRAVLNSEGTRISVGTAHGPPLDCIVSPAPELANPAAYRGIKFCQLSEKTCLDRIRL